jgi:hypothetical protein
LSNQAYAALVLVGIFFAAAMAIRPSAPAPPCPPYQPRQPPPLSSPTILLASHAFGLVVQILFRDLADWSLWQCVADLESLHHFVLAELVFQKFLELVERELFRTLL